MAEIRTYSAEVQKIAELLVRSCSAHSDAGIAHNFSAHTHRLCDFTTLREGSRNNELRNKNCLNSAPWPTLRLLIKSTMIPDQFLDATTIMGEGGMIKKSRGGRIISRPSRQVSCRLLITLVAQKSN